MSLMVLKSTGQVYRWISDKESACQSRRRWFEPQFGRSLEEANGNPLQYSCLENPLDTGGWVATAHEVTESGTRLSAQVYCTYA